MIKVTLEHEEVIVTVEIETKEASFAPLADAIRQACLGLGFSPEIVADYLGEI